MFFRVSLFCYEEGRSNPIRSNYRAPWRLGESDELHTGSVILKKNRCLAPGQHDTAILQPLNSCYWQDVRVGDSLNCFEGTKKVATALIVEVFE
jgi:hypothetical protein